jgi:DNA polymerase
MIIGEGPGRAEDEKGKPFVGRAGKLLDHALQSAELRRDEVFITNVVKCRPPRNRVPSKGERETCAREYLDPQLDLVKPELVVLLGRTATLVLLNKQILHSVRGRILRIGGRDYLPTYHPAAVLRNPRLKRTFVRDIKKIRSHVKMHRVEESPLSQPGEQDH